MTLSDISIKRPVFAWMLMAGLLVFGALSYSLMGVSQLPDVDFPVITVTVTWAGASPDVMETAVADIIEDAVMSVDGIQLVQSTSQQGQTQITIQFTLNQDVNVSLLEVQTKVSQASKNLPQNIDPPVITKINPNDQAILWATISAPGYPLRDLTLFVRDHLKDAMTTVSGVGDVQLAGYVDPQMRIWLDNNKMLAHDVTAADIMSAVTNEHQLSPTGYQDHGSKETYIRIQSEFTNAKECEALVIPARAGQALYKTIHLGEVATCNEGTDEIRAVSRFNGVQPTIGLGIIKQHGTNAMEIANSVKAKIKALTAILPKGMTMDIATDTTAFIHNAIHELLSTLVLSVVLTSVVCYLFLGTLSSAFNVVLAIPVSLIGTFIILKAFNFTINTFTLMGLSLSIGIVVDDAIMVLENITRHAEEGMSRVKASFVGAREITGAAVAASLAILAIFVPVIFMPGIVGKFFYQFGVTISVAVMISLLEALTLAPMRCSQFLSLGGGNFVTRRVSQFMDKLSTIYRHMLSFALQGYRRYVVLFLAVALFALSLLTAKFLRKEFVPPQDQSFFIGTVYTAMGSSLELTDGVFKEVEATLKRRPEVKSYYVALGGFTGGLVNQGVIVVNMKDTSNRPFAAPFTKMPTQQQFMVELRQEVEKISGVERIALLDLSLAGFSAQRGYPIEFELQGPEWSKLAAYSLDIRKRLKDSGLMADVDSDYNPNMPETEIVPNREAAASRALPVSAIATEISATVGGLKLLPNKYTDSHGHRDDIQIKLLPDQNQSSVDISKINVRNNLGWAVPLNQVVDMSPSSTLLTITRYNRERGISIFGNFAAGKSQSDVMDYVKDLGQKILPEGYRVVLSGSSQAFNDSLASLALAFGLGIFVAYMVLASQFNSFLHPVIILLALPFSVTGALWMMWLTDTSLNIYSIIGILLLMGIVKKNSILLVEFTNHVRERGHDVNDALLEACPVRLRPILMTSIATVAAAIPEALSNGAGSETIRPMAVAVVGGVTVSTFLTLFVVPCAYSLCARLEGHQQQEQIREALVDLGEIDDIGPMPIGAV